jgi:Ca2+-binding EF-hand superfamily protein
MTTTEAATTEIATTEVATTEVEAAHIQEFIFCEKTFNKSKEDFLWFIKKAVACKTSDAYGELFMKLLKKFVDADTNKDGLVSKDHFLKLVTGFIPVGPMQEDDETLGKMFDAMDLKHTGVITFDEWLKFCLEHIEKTVAKLDPHPILNHGTKEEFKAFATKAVEPGTAEHTELFWYILECFIDHDSNKDGNVTQYAFMALVDKVLALPLKLDLVKTDEKFFGENLSKKEEIRKEQFTKYNIRGDGKLSFDEFLTFCMENIFMKMLLDD